MENLVEDAEDFEEIERSIIGLETLKEKQNELQMKCEFILGDAYEAEMHTRRRCIRGGDAYEAEMHTRRRCIRGGVWLKI